MHKMFSALWDITVYMQRQIFKYSFLYNLVSDTIEEVMKCVEITKKKQPIWEKSVEVFQRKWHLNCKNEWNFPKQRRGERIFQTETVCASPRNKKIMAHSKKNENFMEYLA